MSTHDRTESASLTAALREAESLGRHEGAAAGSWAIDGNTSDQEARAVLAAFEDGTYFDNTPGPLSGEWADTRSPRDLYEDATGQDAHADASFNSDAYHSLLDTLCNTYEAEWFAAYERTATYSARYQLGEVE